MVNYRLKEKLLEVVDNQISADDPTCTKKTLERLINIGYTKQESKEMIAAIFVEDMYDILKNESPFNEEEFCRKLESLPVKKEMK